MTDYKMPLTAHLEELRKRLIVSFIALAVGFGISYGFKEKLFFFLSRPLEKHLPEGSTLQYIGIPEAFLTYLKISLFGGLFLAMPVILYEVWRFVAPGLYEREKRYFIPFVVFSMLFFLGGASFCYFIVFPFVFRFFMSFSGDSLLAMPAIRQYLSFATRLLFAFGLVFEMPIFIFFLGRIGLVSYKGLARQRRMAVVLVFLGAALLTPPDVVSQLMLAGPLLILFELSIQIVRITGKKPSEESEEEEEEEEAEEAPAG
jgi:sec-independent protein translocase protein TatC